MMLAYPARAGMDGGSAVVARFQAGLLETMKKAEELGVKGRFERLAPLIETNFHLPLMIATASSPFWRTGTSEQKHALLAAFKRMSASTVATLFDGYDGESFRVVRERAAGGPTALVDTQIVRPKNDPIDITYVTAKLRDRWWIIDIIVEGGISEVKTRRNEYLKLLKEGGLERLTRALDDHATRLLAGRETAQVTN
jgi:phospholipid transport system substrate-binding protein